MWSFLCEIIIYFGEVRFKKESIVLQQTKAHPLFSKKSGCFFMAIKQPKTKLFNDLSHRLPWLFRMCQCQPHIFTFNGFDLLQGVKCPHGACECWVSKWPMEWRLITYDAETEKLCWELRRTAFDSINNSPLVISVNRVGLMHAHQSQMTLGLSWFPYKIPKKLCLG